jgi:hypothetical protein
LASFTALTWRLRSGVAPQSKMSSVAPGRALISSSSALPSFTRKSAEARPLILKARATPMTAEAIRRAKSSGKDAGRTAPP